PFSFDHRPGNRPQAQCRAAEVDRYVAVEVGHLLVENGSEERNPRVQEPDIDLAEVAQRGLDHARVCVDVGYRTRYTNDVCLRVTPLERVGVAVDSNDLCSVVEEATSRGSADAGASSSNDCYPISKVGHGRLSVVEDAVDGCVRVNLAGLTDPPLEFAGDVPVPQALAVSFPSAPFRVTKVHHRVAI